MLPKTSNVFGLALALAVTMVSFGVHPPLQHHHRLYAMYRGRPSRRLLLCRMPRNTDSFAMYQRTRSRGRDIPSCRVLILRQVMRPAD